MNFLKNNSEYFIGEKTTLKGCASDVLSSVPLNKLKDQLNLIKSKLSKRTPAALIMISVNMDYFKAKHKKVLQILRALEDRINELELENMYEFHNDSDELQQKIKQLIQEIQSI